MTDGRITPEGALSPRQQFLSDLWDRHLQHEFADHDTEDALDTMIEGAHVNHAPVLGLSAGRPSPRPWPSCRSWVRR